jgi:hypothetical protein
LAVVFGCKFQAVGITLRKKPGFIVCATAPDRAHSVNHPFGRESESRRYFGFACLASVEQFAGIEQFGSGCTMNGSINTSTTQQRLISGVYNGIYFKFGDIVADKLYRESMLGTHLFTDSF